jgi:hypothetical protein
MDTTCNHKTVDECTRAEILKNRSICQCGNDTFYYDEGIHYGDRYCTKCFTVTRHFPLHRSN